MQARHKKQRLSGIRIALRQAAPRQLMDAINGGGQRLMNHYLTNGADGLSF
jgi:hypothetical protein